MSLPTPTPTQAYCDVSALEAGIIHPPTERHIHDGKPAEVVAPSLSTAFLLRHTRTGYKLLSNLVEGELSLSIIRSIEQFFRLDTPRDILCLSHLYFSNHLGDTMKIGAFARTGYWLTCNTLDKLDDQTMKMRQQLKELEYQRNSRALICRLPVEIIGKIFTLTTSRIDSWN
ncbi:hypothetical protein PQX77_010565 [Marasmius sp. AFHP31]|nr:hypothetical protein PQX77_010565 [Marasmius sp. AFHP31]